MGEVSADAGIAVPMDLAENFVRKAILAGRGNYKGLHCVYSGLNSAMKKVWPGCNPIAITNALASSGKFILIPRKGGPMIYLPEDAPSATNTGGDKLLAKLGNLGEFAL
jgi:hypothetical protein